MLKNSTGRLMSISIIFSWLAIAISTTVIPAYHGAEPVVIDIPYAWAGAAVLFYYGRNISPEVIQSIILRFLGMKAPTND